MSAEVVGLVFILMLGCGLSAVLAESDRPIVIAHRGASGALPEHTLAAKAMAHAMGADYLEQDVVLTKDQVAVVLHDIHLDTVSDVARVFPKRVRDDGRYYAIDFTLSEIRQLKANERIDLKTGKAVFPGRFPVGSADFRIPTLGEEIELIQGMNKSRKMNVGIYPEIKQPAWHRKQGYDPSRVVLDVLTKYGYTTHESNVFMQCFDREETRRIREELKSPLPLIQLWDDEPISDEDLKSIAEYADGIGPSLQLLYDKQSGKPARPSELVANAHKHGLQVHPWTIRSDSLPKFVDDYPALIRFVFETNKCDGAFSDFPDTTLQLLAN